MLCCFVIRPIKIPHSYPVVYEYTYTWNDGDFLAKKVTKGLEEFLAFSFPPLKAGARDEGQEDARTWKIKWATNFTGWIINRIVITFLLLLLPPKT